MQDYSLRLLEVRSAQFGVPNTYMLVKIEANMTRGPVTTVPYILWDELRVKLSSVGIEDCVLQNAKEILDLTGTYKITECQLSYDQWHSSAFPARIFLGECCSSNVSGCEQTVKSIPDRVCDVPLRMLQVPRPELNRCTTRECSA